jgi:hypothetical protein
VRAVLRHRLWREDTKVLRPAGSHAINDAVEAGAGQVETLELGHRYGHLSPMVNVA